MRFADTILLGSAAAIMGVGAASAADLPSRKAAPVEYVKVCDAYGAGFFYLPGTETCLKVGGRVRADYSFNGRGDIISNSFAATTAVAGTPSVTVFDPTNTTAAVGVIPARPAVPSTISGLGQTVLDSDAVNTYGWEVRGRVDLDARTPTAWGTVQTVLALRLSRTTGNRISAGPGLSPSSASPTLEAAYIRFAGFTFGVARDNFSFMPSLIYAGQGHWSAFQNGAKQVAYTAVFGGGLSATVAVQDLSDTTAGGVVAGGFFGPTGAFVTPLPSALAGSSAGAPAYAYNNIPQLNGRVDWTQGWGSLAVSGAVSKAVGVNTTASFDEAKTVWALGAGVKINLPMLAAGDALWLTAAYAQGMTEYTTNWTSFKSASGRVDVPGYVVNHPSWIYTADPSGAGRIETLKSWNVGGIFAHYWTPSIRHSFLASYGRIEGTSASRALVFGQSGAFGDATVWNVGTQLAWLPVRNFEIGVQVIYARVNQDIRTFTPGAIGLTPNAAFAAGATTVSRQSDGGWTGRMRVERTF
jgi:hypothetical protein